MENVEGVECFIENILQIVFITNKPIINFTLLYCKKNIFFIAFEIYSLYFIPFYLKSCRELQYMLDAIVLN